MKTEKYILKYYDRLDDEENDYGEKEKCFLTMEDLIEYYCSLLKENGEYINHEWMKYRYFNFEAHFMVSQVEEIDLNQHISPERVMEYILLGLEEFNQRCAKNKAEKEKAALKKKYADFLELKKLFEEKHEPTDNNKK